MVLMQRIAGIRLEYGPPRFLDLQENRIVIGGHEQPERAIGADAAHADDLDREVEQLKSVEQYANMLGQRRPISLERLGIPGFHSRSLLVCGVEDQRRLILDP